MQHTTYRKEVWDQRLDNKYRQGKEKRMRGGISIQMDIKHPCNLQDSFNCNIYQNLFRS